MKNTDTFRQYTWMVDTILRNERISFERIGHLWIVNDLNEGKPLSRTTFYRLRQSIIDMFGIRIECDKQHHYLLATQRHSETTLPKIGCSAPSPSAISSSMASPSRTNSCLKTYLPASNTSKPLSTLSSATTPCKWAIRNSTTPSPTLL